MLFYFYFSTIMVEYLLEPSCTQNNETLEIIKNENLKKFKYLK